MFTSTELTNSLRYSTTKEPLGKYSLSELTIRKKRIISQSLIAIMISGFLLMAAKSAYAESSQTALPEVTVTQPIARSITSWDNYVGKFEASQHVEVKPQVSGQIIERRFKDGDTVKKGDVLFIIDPRSYLAAKTAAKADEMKAESNVLLARSELYRALRLKGDESLSSSELDVLRAKVRGADAEKAAASALSDQRDLEFAWTRVRAPISGRISDRRIDVGNLVEGGLGTQATLLTTINAVDPIYFTFDASEALFLKSQRNARSTTRQPSVQIRLQDEQQYDWSGTVDFTDNQLDPHSGTIKLRALIANPNNFLTPGLFGNMRMASGDPKNAFLIPDEAVHISQNQSTLWVVNNQGIITSKNVVTGALMGGLRVIESGISKEDKVVTSGSQMVAIGSKVNVIQQDIHLTQNIQKQDVRGLASSQATINP